MKLGYFHLPHDQSPPDIPKRPFRAVVVLEQTTSPEWRAIISKWLVDSGCLYMMAWGPDSSSWDDSVDWTNLENFDFGEIPDDRFVMTTWHDDEPLSETFWFSEHTACHPTVTIDETIIIDVAPHERRIELEQLLEAARKQPF